MPRYVNLGCGARVHPAWINIDLVAAVPGVLAHDLRDGIPLEDDSCDAVYHSHVLEHIPAEEAEAFLRECRRVLRPGGVLRVAIPDLEVLGRVYAEILADLEAGRADRAADHEWILLELYDQTVRTRPGGRMLEYLAQERLPNEAFVLDRIGVEGEELLRRRPNGGPPAGAPSLVRRVGARLRVLPGRIRRRVAHLLLTRAERAALATGEFRSGGEVHQWMYDRFSLARLLERAGFEQPAVRDATGSAIPGWRDFHLDTLSDGTVVKPDSLYMEARKPS